MLSQTRLVTGTVTDCDRIVAPETGSESVRYSVDASSPPDARMLRHSECGSHPAPREEISSKFGWGGSRVNSGGPRENSGGQRIGAGRKPAAKSVLTGSRKPASKTLAEARIVRSLASLSLPFGDGDRWYCAQTRYRMELIAVEELTKQGFSTLLPRTERELPDKRRIIVPMFPGYVLIRFDRNDDRWRPIVSTPGIRSLFSSSPEAPIPAPVGEIERLIAGMGADGIMREPVEPTPEPFEAGQYLRVTEGPFTSLSGVCRMSSGRRVKLLLEVFGREVPTEVDASQVELVA